MTADRSRIRVKAMLIALDATRERHVVSVNPPTVGDPIGYHRLIGGSVEFGETHRDAIVREVCEELGATIHGLTYVAVVENIFRLNGEAGHEVVFLYTGTLDPLPAPSGAHLTESDGAVQPVAWRPVRDEGEQVPLYPRAVAEIVRALAGGHGASPANGQVTAGRPRHSPRGTPGRV